VGVSPERRRCWVESANDPETDFPLENLPFGLYDDARGGRMGIAIGDQIFDLRRCAEVNLLEGLSAHTVKVCRDGLWMRELVLRKPTAASELRDRVEKSWAMPAGGRLRSSACSGKAACV